MPLRGMNLQMPLQPPTPLGPNSPPSPGSPRSPVGWLPFTVRLGTADGPRSPAKPLSPTSPFLPWNGSEQAEGFCSQFWVSLSTFLHHSFTAKNRESKLHSLLSAAFRRLEDRHGVPVHWLNFARNGQSHLRTLSEDVRFVHTEVWDDTIF